MQEAESNRTPALPDTKEPCDRFVGKEIPACLLFLMKRDSHGYDHLFDKRVAVIYNGSGSKGIPQFSGTKSHLA